MNNHQINKTIDNTQNNVEFANSLDPTTQSLHDALMEKIERNKKFIEAHKEWVRNRKRFLT